MVRTRCAPCLAALLLLSPALAAKSYSNEFAVFVPAGRDVADQLAAKHGFRYLEHLEQAFASWGQCCLQSAD